MEEYKKERFELLDILRGASIILMIVIHALYDLTFIFPSEFFAGLYYAIAPYGYCASFTFILISGICARFTRSNLKRGARLLLISFALTLITFTFIPNEAIFSGILHMFSISMLLYGVFENKLQRIPNLTGIIASLVLFLIFFNLQAGYLGFQGIYRVFLPERFYQTDLLYMFGFHTNQFYSSDYWPVFPWTFLFLTGTFIGGYIKDGKYPSILKKISFKPLSFPGRHSLVIYIAHQPVIYGFLWLIYHL